MIQPGHPFSVAAVIPTFNEEAELSACLRSLLDQADAPEAIIVVNAGKPLSVTVGALCSEVNVSADSFWTASMQRGFDEAVSRGFDAVLMSNADLEFLPGTVGRLRAYLSEHPGHVACSAGYRRLEDGSLRLQYSRDMVVPFLLHNYLRRDWTTDREAWDRPVETDMAGGQGVMFSTDYLKRVRMDPARFPQYKGDHDFWKSMHRAGAKMFTVPGTGIVNRRPLAEKAFGRLKSFSQFWWYLSSPYAPESLVTQWRYRRKHLPLLAAIVSYAITVPSVWSWRVVRATVWRVRAAFRRS